MDTPSLIIGSVLLLLFVGPILYAIWMQNHKERKQLRKLNEIGSGQNLKFDYTEISNSLLLGLDAQTKKLVVIEPGNNMQFNIIDLNKIGNSKILKKAVPNPDRSKGRERIIQISLELLENHGKNKATEILFYDEDGNDGADMSTRLFVAEKWDKLIHTSLSA
ncbi:hypothetical protein [Autumnicola musiva]|uniref:Uncharacterized protein n=1 Tax=Autumnicola musiva TaxID=3075589 RepID=A0ABU3D197_9FLAO|nr:hypothetical protein [Zunongwangia sp. F117]MDT0675308.1 hypothetical protein [Zunongwangia sp. F117]